MDKNYGLTDCQLFYTYYDVGTVFLGVQLPIGVVWEAFTVTDWLKILDKEKERALSFITPMPKYVVQGFENGE